MRGCIGSQWSHANNNKFFLQFFIKGVTVLNGIRQKYQTAINISKEWGVLLVISVPDNKFDLLLAVPCVQKHGNNLIKVNLFRCYSLGFCVHKGNPRIETPYAVFSSTLQGKTSKRVRMNLKTLDSTRIQIVILRENIFIGLVIQQKNNLTIIGKKKPDRKKFR